MSNYLTIDRDDAHFRTILNFLRDGYVPLPDTSKEWEELNMRANFYCIVIIKIREQTMYIQKVNAVILSCQNDGYPIATKFIR